MNDRYLFRAKRIDNGEWVEGHLITDEQDEKKCFIGYVFWTNDVGTPHDYDVVSVDPSTICQYTGLTDKNGKKICENDIVRHEDLTNGRYIARKQPMKNSVIKWNCKEVKFERSDRRDIYKPESRLEVIGNIFDNPELLEVENGESR